MRYQVMAGDSPAGIARKLTGNAGRMGDLLAANPSKPVALSQGLPTFASLHVGEVLNVPRSWRQFGMGSGQGTTDAVLGQAAQNVMNLNDPCNLSQSCAVVQGFQTAWNNTSDPNMHSSLDNSGNPIGTLVDDGKYGQETSAAVEAALGTQSPSPCGSYSGSCGGGGGGGGGNFNSSVISAAQALDAQLAAQGCCGCGQAGSALSNAVAAFKQAILVNPGDWGSSSSASTVTGSTINVSDPACQIAFGSELGGTLADLKSVLGSSMTYTGSYCCTSNCACVNMGSNCGQQPPPPPPACVAPQVPDSVTNQCVNPCP
ncbi:MAG TPA: hypothetical protein VE987_09745, partial [Polyangiaceae bacterium]|nr:hypothetical protein [Polyangiaceae bacterium]